VTDERTTRPSRAESIINPDAPLALRLSGQLMLGVVRIYSRKVNYLFQDCSEALVKIKQVFRPGTVDLPADANTAPDATITLPDDFDELESFFDPGIGGVGGGRGNAAVGRANISLADPDLDDFDAQFAYNERLPLEDERLEDDVEVEVFRSSVVQAGVQLEDYDYAHDEYQAPEGGDDDQDDGFDDATFGMGEDIMPLALDPDLIEDAAEPFSARKSVGGDSLFGGALPSLPGSSILGDRPAEEAPGPARKRRRVERVVVFDRTVTLSNDHIRNQLKDTSDIVNHRAPSYEDDGVLSDPETLEASLRGRLMACDVGSKLDSAYQKASDACWGRPGVPNEQRGGGSALDDMPTAPRSMNFDYADDDDMGFGDVGYAGADDFNLELATEEAADAQEDEDMDWNVNSKIMLEHLTSAFAASGDKPLSLSTLTTGKKRGEAARMFYQVLVLNAHEYLQVDQLTPYGDVAMAKGRAFAT